MNSLKRQASVWDFLLWGKESFRFGFEAEESPISMAQASPSQWLFTEPGLQCTFSFVLVKI